MKDIYEILKGLDIEIPEDKKDTFDKEWKENYRTKNEYDKAVEARDRYKTSLDDVQKKLDAFKDVDVDDLKGQVSTLRKQLEEEKQARADDAHKAEIEKTATDFLSGKKFVNALTEKSIRASLIEELDKDSAKGKSVEEIFKALITDKDGNQMDNILVDESEGPKPKFTEPKGPGTGGGRKLTMSELMKLKNENPNINIEDYM